MNYTEIKRKARILGYCFYRITWLSIKFCFTNDIVKLEALNDELDKLDKLLDTI